MDPIMIGKEIALWGANNWGYVVLGIYVLDVVVKLTPWQWDDVTVTIIKKVLGKVLGRNLDNPEMLMDSKSKEEK